MIYSVDFLELTEQINPLAFVKYLKDTGWNSFQIMRKNIRVFQKEMGGAFHQITLPMDKQLSDYKEAMYRAVKTVSEVECRSFEQIMLYLLNPNTDILKIRLDKKQIETGSITFDDAIRMYENTKKLLAATALDILHPTVTPALGQKAGHNGRVVYSLDFKVTPHQLRHTYITNLIYASVDPKTVQYLAGHENSKMTMDIYAKVKYNKPEQLLSVVNGAFA